MSESITEREYGVRCTMVDGTDAMVTLSASSADKAGAEIDHHRRMFYGPGDGAGRWLAARCPSSTIVAVHEAKPIEEWD